jgi:tetratricopeptide (TPR) repeat protein
VKKCIIARSCLAAALILVFAHDAAAATSQARDEAWKTLDQAKYAFERKEFDEALRLVDGARAAHRARIESDRAILSKAVLSGEPKKAGDDLVAVYRALVKRGNADAISVLDRIYLTHEPYDFGNSFSRLLRWLEESLDYPEADALAGMIYKTEGEYAVAMSFLKKAWDARRNLDIPDESYGIAYAMADIAEAGGDHGVREECLLLVLTDDAVYGSPGKESSTLLAMTNSLKVDPSLTKFFFLYRNDRLVALKAYQDLAQHYQDSGRIDRAYPVAVLAAITSLTVLEKNLRSVDFQYAYSSFEDLVRRSSRNAKVTQWAREQRVWDSFLILSSIMWENGEREQAKYLWNCLAESCPDGAIARKASGALALRER